ncbi:hypothetical protein [Flavobacterium sp.]|jgi:hypothetical protein|uniref:hypothetical protein n=1 Tax=Flavobacterium sp. TaxID=239 RepID=UPI0037C19846
MSTIVNKFGVMQGWNAVTANLLGRDLEGVTELAYSDSQKKENVYGAGAFPIGRGRGNYEAKATITLLKEEVDALKLALPAGKTIQDIAPFDIVVEYETENGSIKKDRIRNAEFMGDGVEVKQNDMSIATKYELLISHIEWNVI